MHQPESVHVIETAGAPEVFQQVGVDDLVGVNDED